MDLVVVVASAAVIAAFFVAWWAVAGPQDRVDLTGRGDQPTDLRSRVLLQRPADRVARPMMERFGDWLRRRSPAARVSNLSTRLARAGSPPRWTVERVLAVKVLSAAVLGALVFVFVIDEPDLLGVFWILLAATLGYFVPNAILDRIADRRRAAVRAELSDVIDQLSMMVRSGLGVDAAIARAARSSHGPMAEELTRVGHDVRVGVERSVALANLADRVDVPELHTFVASLAQAERLGVPVSRTLEIQARELRLKRRQYAEEQAMKLPVKLLFPMVFCIFPTLLVILLAPAAIEIVRQLG